MRLERLPEPGDWEAIGRYWDELLERFWKRVLMWGPDDCWHWMGRMNPDGYGSITVAGTAMGAHIVAFWSKNEDAPDRGVVRHTCDNRGCVNPRHLIAGTHADNMQDMVERGRSVRGRRGQRGVGTTRRPRLRVPTYSRRELAEPRPAKVEHVYCARRRAGFRFVPAKRDPDGRLVPIPAGELDVERRRRFYPETFREPRVTVRRKLKPTADDLFLCEQAARGAWLSVLEPDNRLTAGAIAQACGGPRTLSRGTDLQTLVTNLEAIAAGVVELPANRLSLLLSVSASCVARDGEGWVLVEAAAAANQ